MELILIDDASEDGTGELLLSLRNELGDWVRVLRLASNQGAAAARNAGWEAARADYVAFLDADDSWLPPKLERQHGFMRSHPEYGLTGHRARYGHANDGAPQGHSDISRLAVVLKNPMVTPSLMAKRDLPVRFDAAARHMEDHRFLQHAVFSGVRVARIEDVLVVIHKPAYGAGGLSARLWAMERGDLANYGALRSAGRIGVAAYVLLMAYSLAKFCRRAVLVGLRRLGGSTR